MAPQLLGTRARRTVVAHVVQRRRREEATVLQVGQRRLDLGWQELHRVGVCVVLKSGEAAACRDGPLGGRWAVCHFVLASPR